MTANNLECAICHQAKRDARRGSRLDEPAAYHAEGILYLPAEARFDYLLNRPEAENIGAKVNAVMRDVAKCEVRVANSEVQSVRHSSFVIRHSSRLSIHGVEKTDETGRLCRLNLAVHGLEGEIKHGGKPSRGDKVR